jgi:subtilisin family serine protease
VLHHWTLSAARTDPEFAFGILLDEVVLTFDPSASDGEITGAISACGGVLQAQYPREFETAHLPTSDLLRDAIHYDFGRSGVRVALPNMPVELQGPNPFIGMPDDPQYDQGPPDEFLSLHMASIRAPEAWSVTTGTPAVVVAVVDSGFDVLHEDILDNVWINPTEIPASVRAAFVDQDGDGIITFAELNAPANDGLCPRGNSDPFDRCDPLDLVNGNCPGGVCEAGDGWQDGADGVEAGEANGLIDDIIGWDF